MVLTFLGTREEIEIRSRAHRRHSSPALDAGAGIVMIDCGVDWAAAVWKEACAEGDPAHARPSRPRRRPARRQPVHRLRVCRHRGRNRGLPWVKCMPIEPRAPFELAGELRGVHGRAFASRAGGRFRVTSGLVSIFYVPDVVAIHDSQHAMDGVELYIGDGRITAATIRRLGRAVGVDATIARDWSRLELSATRS